MNYSDKPRIKKVKMKERDTEKVWKIAEYEKKKTVEKKITNTEHLKKRK